MTAEKKKLLAEIESLKNNLCPVLRENYELKKEIDTQRKHRVELTEQMRDMMATAKRRD